VVDAQRADEGDAARTSSDSANSTYRVERTPDGGEYIVEERGAPQGRADT
jgi:hypothetical protein